MGENKVLPKSPVHGLKRPAKTIIPIINKNIYPNPTTKRFNCQYPMKTLKTILTIFFLIGVFFTVYKTLEYFKIRGQRLGGVTSLNITGHVMSTGTPPTLVAGGTGYQTTSVQAGSTDFKGSFTGTVPGGAGQLQIKFVTAYNFAPVCLANIISAQPTTTFYVTSSVSGMALNFIAGNVSGTKQFNYFCIQ